MSGAWVYMLRCRDGSLYTGWTSDLDRRMARHQAGKASRYTASRLPVELALVLPMADRTAARREEARIKLLPRAGKLALITEVKLARRIDDRPFIDLDAQKARRAGHGQDLTRGPGREARDQSRVVSG
jgi:putative endonuclease